MKILVISQYYYPEIFRINDIVKELVQRRHQVTVLTGLPNYPEGVVPQEYRHGRKRHERIDGAEIIRCFEIGRKKGKFWLGMNYLSFTVASSVNAALMKKRFDVIYIFQPSPVFSTVPAWVYKRRHGTPIFLYCCDLWPESMKVYHISENGRVFRLIKRISTFLYRQCDKIAVTSPGFVDYLKEVHQIPEEKIMYLPQYAEDVFRDMDLTAPEDDCVDFVFCGNVGKVQNLECVVKAVSHIRTDKKFKVHIVGDGSNLQKLKWMVDELHLEDKFEFYGMRPFEEMWKYYKLADVFLITLKNEKGSLIGDTIPGKLQSYMSVGKPIIGAIEGAVRDIVEEAQCGYCVDARDAGGLGRVMGQFIEIKEDVKKLGLNCKLFYEQNYSKEKYFYEINKTFLKLLTLKFI